jgi:hypothetical protein
MAVTAALSPSSLPQSSTGLLEVTSVLARRPQTRAVPQGFWPTLQSLLDALPAHRR